MANTHSYCTRSCASVWTISFMHNVYIYMYLPGNTCIIYAYAHVQVYIVIIVTCQAIRSGTWKTEERLLLSPSSQAEQPGNLPACKKTIRSSYYIHG